MFQQILLFLTGIVLLVFGMVKTGDGTQRILSVKIRQYIKHLSRKPTWAISLGAISTAIFQSSATSVMITIGMVSAGLISFVDSLGLVLGADIGTTITAQLVALKITTISPIFIIVGVILWFSNKEKLKSIGEALFYFGLLFFGLHLINQAIIPWKKSQFFLNLFQGIKNPFIGILIGFIITVILNSSSATTSILVLLGSQGLVTIGASLPLILGANLGTTVDPFLLSLRKGINARRTGFSHFFFKFLAIIIFFPLLPKFTSFLKFLTPNVAQQIASGHLLFNLFMVAIFFFLLKPIAKIIRKILPGEEKILPLWPEYLNKKLLKSPDLALDAVNKELVRGAKLTQKMFNDAIKIIIHYKSSTFQNISYIELVIDALQKDVMQFLNAIPKNKLNREQAEKLIQYSSMVDSIERIGDQSTNLAKLARHKKRFGVKFSKDGIEEILQMKDIIDKDLEESILIIGGNNNDKIDNIFRYEREISYQVDRARKKHLERFYRREVSVADGPIFNDIVLNIERIADHCVDIIDYYKKDETRVKKDKFNDSYK